MNLEVVGDSEFVIGWINDTTRCKCHEHAGDIHNLINRLFEAWAGGEITPRQRHASWARHVYMEFNSHTDEMGTLGLMGNAHQ